VSRRGGGYPAALSVIAACAACAAPPARPAHNAASAAGPRVAIAVDQPLGWIGIAPRRAADPGDWIPAAAQAVLVPLVTAGPTDGPAGGLAEGAALWAIDTAGGLTRVTAAGPAKVRYGCDGQQLDVLAFTGEPSAPGPVWLLPPTAPASWHPRSLAIVPRTAASEVRRRDTVGPLALTLERSAAARGALTIARDGRVVLRLAIERGEMAGADPAPLDLRRPGVAIPEPVAAWSLGDDGPILLVLEVPSYEGVHLTPILVEADRARELPAMSAYLYRCAF
jgi:hypothetical protein